MKSEGTGKIALEHRQTFIGEGVKQFLNIEGFEYLQDDHHDV
ncbi:hypothetical protein [Aliidiomarina celeris]|nr:hypothetical protein [Aliidiomarina celeris]